MLKISANNGRSFNYARVDLTVGGLRRDLLRFLFNPVIGN
jgi:hypothetical protein